MIKEGEGNKQRAKEWKGKGGLEGLGSSPNRKETGKQSKNGEWPAQDEAVLRKNTFAWLNELRRRNRDAYNGLVSREGHRGQRGESSGRPAH